MRANLLLTVAVAVASAVLALLLVTPDARADLDPPGTHKVTDWLEINKLEITKDFDDGDAELCVQVTFRHEGHKVDDGSGPEWLKFDCWEDVETEDAATKPVVLIGKGGLANWKSPVHTECTTSAAWELRVRVTELDGSATLSKIVKDIGKATQEKGVKADLSGWITGAAIGLVTEVLSSIFAESAENVGTGSENWAEGEGDPEGKVPKSDELANFNYEYTKVVKTVPSEPNPCQATPTTTPTPTPCPQCPGTPTPTPHCVPSDPGCCEGFPDTPGCCDDPPLPSCGTPAPTCVPSDPGCCDDYPETPGCCGDPPLPSCGTPTPTPTPTPTLTPTPTATPCPEDADCDNVSDDDEDLYGSNKNDADSTPEHFAYNPLTCLDLLDNDGDGFTDQFDTGCGHGVVGAAPRDHSDTGDEHAFGFDEEHPFGKSKADAAGRWLLLRQAAALVDEVEAETETDHPERVIDIDVPETRRLLRELIGGLGQLVAASEVDEMDSQGGFSQLLIDDARALIAAADAQYGLAKGAGGTTQQLLDALDGYRQAFEMIVVPLHPEYNGAERGDLDCDGDEDTVDALFVLRWTAALAGTPDCIFVADTDCDADIDAVDALKLLRIAAGLPPNLPAGCPDIGST